MKNKSMAILAISVICLVCASDFRIAEAVGPAYGQMTKNNVYVGNNCIVDRLTVKWNLESIAGEPLVNGTYIYTGNCKPSSDFMVWLRLEYSGAYGHVRIAPAIPDSSDVWGFNSPGSPAWDRLLCAYDGTKTTRCISKRSAKKIWQYGRVTDFIVPWKQVLLDKEREGSAKAARERMDKMIRDRERIFRERAAKRKRSERRRMGRGDKGVWFTCTTPDQLVCSEYLIQNPRTRKSFINRCPNYQSGKKCPPGRSCTHKYPDGSIEIGYGGNVSDAAFRQSCIRHKGTPSG